MPANLRTLTSPQSGVYLASGLRVTTDVQVTSGTFTMNSGVGVQIQSGVGVLVSGQMLQVASGQQALTTTRLGTKISGNYLGIEAAATQLPNVAGHSFVVKSLTGNSDIFLAGAGVNSGAGLILNGGNSLSDLKIDNLNRMYGWAVTSGQSLSWLGVTY